MPISEDSSGSGESPSAEDAAPRASGSRVLRWYFALKYRVFRRERRPFDGRRGLVMLQIDALSYAELRRAIELGYCPTISQMVREEGYTLRRWFCGLPSATPYCQAGIMYGENENIPAFRFYDKAERRVITCNSPSGVQYIRDRIDAPGALAGGSSYVNLLDGDAETVAFTVATRERMSVFRRLGGWRMAMLILLHPIRMARMMVQAALEWLREEYERSVGEFRAEAHAQRGIVSLRTDSEQRHRARVADDGDPARRLSRRAHHLQHVHAVRRARPSLRSVELSGVTRSSPHRRAHSRDSAHDREPRWTAVRHGDPVGPRNDAVSELSRSIRRDARQDGGSHSRRATRPDAAT